MDPICDFFKPYEKNINNNNNDVSDDDDGKKITSFAYEPRRKECNNSVFNANKDGLHR